MQERESSYTALPKEHELKELGNLLRQLREAQGLSYEDVAQTTHIRPFILKAIEEARLQDLSQIVYTRSFIKSYCEFLCAPDLWSKYESAVIDSRERVPQSQTLNSEKNYSPEPRAVFRKASFTWIYWVLLIAVFVAGYLLWSLKLDWNTHPLSAPLSDINSSSNEAPTPPLRSPDLPAIAASKDVSAEVRQNGRALSSDNGAQSVDISWLDAQNPSTARPPAVASGQKPETEKGVALQLSVTKRTWVGVYQGNSALFSGFLGSEQSKTFYVTVKTRVRIGNGSSVNITWNGKPIENQAKPGVPATYFFHPDGKIEKGKSR